MRGGMPVDAIVSIELSRLGPAVTSAYELLLGGAGGSMSRDVDPLLGLRGGSVGGKVTLSVKGDFDFDRSIDMLGSSVVRRSQLGLDLG